MSWSGVSLNETEQAELDALPREFRASFERISNLIQTFGIERVHEPYIKHLEGSLWEMRLKGKDGIARSIYLPAVGRHVVVLRVFTKKTQKTPRREIELPRQRAKEVQ